MFNYKDKYLKYKKKYLLLKGGNYNKIIWDGEYNELTDINDNINYTGNITIDDKKIPDKYTWRGELKLKKDNGNDKDFEFKGFVFNNNKRYSTCDKYINLSYKNITKNGNEISADTEIHSQNNKFIDTGYKYLIIGGGQKGLYSEEFFDIGGHDSSKYGCNKDWNNINFWINLSKYLGDKKFITIMIDRGSGSWLKDCDDNTLKEMCSVIKNLLFNEGYVIIDSEYFANPSFLETEKKIIVFLIKIGFIKYKQFMLKDTTDSTVNLILKKSIILYDIKNTEGLYDVDIILGKKNEGQYIDYIEDLKRVNEETQQEFIKNRIN